MALAMLGGLLLIAIVLGIIDTKARQSDARTVEQENGLVKEIVNSVLQGTLEPDEITKEKSDRKSRLTKQLRMTARSPYLVSHASDLWDVSLFPSPLSALSVGASRNWPDQYRVHGVSLSKTIERSDQVRPITGANGPFDVAFVVMAISPLVVIGLTFNASSRDRETALQNLIVAQTPSLGKLMAIRCFVRAALVSALVVGVVNVALLIALGNQFDSNVIVNLVIWNVVATLYLLTWASLGLFVNSFAKSSSANGAGLLLLWLILVLLVPRFVSYVVQEAVPTLPESALVEREKNTFDRASENVDGLVERFQSEHPQIEVDREDEQQMTLLRYLLAHSQAGRQATENVSSYYWPQSKRAKYLDFCNWISPAISVRNQSDQCSGNSERAFIAFSARAAEVQAEVLEVFLRPSVTNEQCTVETIAALPSFQETDIPKRISFLNSILSIVSMLVWLTILVNLGLRRFREKDLSRQCTRLPQKLGAENA